MNHEWLNISADDVEKFTALFRDELKRAFAGGRSVSSWLSKKENGNAALTMTAAAKNDEESFAPVAFAARGLTLGAIAGECEETGFSKQMAEAMSRQLPEKNDSSSTVQAWTFDCDGNRTPCVVIECSQERLTLEIGGTPVACECGAASVGSPHASYCPKAGK